jgi:hypothetical protein
MSCNFPVLVAHLFNCFDSSMSLVWSSLVYMILVHVYAHCIYVSVCCLYVWVLWITTSLWVKNQEIVFDVEYPIFQWLNYKMMIWARILCVISIRGSKIWVIIFILSKIVLKRIEIFCLTNIMIWLWFKDVLLDIIDAAICFKLWC